MSETKKSELAEFMRERIEASELSYEEIANRCGYKSDRSIRLLATGRIPVPIDQASNIAEAIGCNPDKFIMMLLRTVLPDDVIVHMGRAIQKYHPYAVG